MRDIHISELKVVLALMKNLEETIPLEGPEHNGFYCYEERWETLKKRLVALDEELTNPKED